MFALAGRRLTGNVRRKKMNPDKLAASFPRGIHFPSELRDLCEWLEKNGYPISGGFELRADDYEAVRHWFGHPRVVDRFGVFGAGPDGSLYAMWKQEDGRQPIVHMGSEGQNNFVLAGSFRDFLRLLAVGYSEIGFDDLTVAPSEREEINPQFQHWIEKRYSLPIPRCGSEVTVPASSTHEDFQAWIEKNL